MNIKHLLDTASLLDIVRADYGKPETEEVYLQISPAPGNSFTFHARDVLSTLAGFPNQSDLIVRLNDDPTLGTVDLASFRDLCDLYKKAVIQAELADFPRENRDFKKVLHLHFIEGNIRVRHTLNIKDGLRNQKNGIGASLIFHENPPLVNLDHEDQFNSVPFAHGSNGSIYIHLTPLRKAITGMKGTMSIDGRFTVDMKEFRKFINGGEFIYFDGLHTLTNVHKKTLTLLKQEKEDCTELGDFQANYETMETAVSPYDNFIGLIDTGKEMILERLLPLAEHNHHSEVKLTGDGFRLIMYPKDVRAEVQTLDISIQNGWVYGRWVVGDRFEDAVYSWQLFNTLMKQYMNTIYMAFPPAPLLCLPAPEQIEQQPGEKPESETAVVSVGASLANYLHRVKMQGWTAEQIQRFVTDQRFRDLIDRRLAKSKQAVCWAEFDTHLSFLMAQNIYCNVL